MNKLEQLQKDVADAEAVKSHVYGEWKDDGFHLDAGAAWEASMVASSKARKALADYLRQENLPLSDLELLRQGKIRAVGKVRARKLKRKCVPCWWSPELNSLVWASTTGESGE